MQNMEKCLKTKRKKFHMTHMKFCYKRDILIKCDLRFNHLRLKPFKNDEIFRQSKHPWHYKKKTFFNSLQTFAFSNLLIPWKKFWSQILRFILKLSFKHIICSDHRVVPKNRVESGKRVGARERVWSQRGGKQRIFRGQVHHYGKLL